MKKLTKKQGLCIISGLSHFETIAYGPELADKIYLALVYLKAKPSTFYNFSRQCLYDKNLLAILSDFCQTLKKLGLCYGLTTYPLDERPKKFIVLWVAKNKRCLRRGLRVKNHREIGLALGFPETAVKAFCGDKGYHRFWFEEDKHLYPPEIVKNFGYGYIMSKENWREEIKTLKQWYRTLKKYAPGLLKQHGRLKIIQGELVEEA